MAIGVNVFWEERTSSVGTAFGSTGSDDVAFGGLTLGRYETIANNPLIVANSCESQHQCLSRRSPSSPQNPTWADDEDQTRVLSLWSPWPHAAGSSVLSLMLAATFPVVATTSSRERATVRATGIKPAFSAWETEVAQASRDAKVVSFEL